MDSPLRWLLWWLVAACLTVAVVWVGFGWLASRGGMALAYAVVVPVLLAGWWLFHRKWGDTFQEAVLMMLSRRPWVLAVLAGLLGAILLIILETIAWSGWD